MGGDSIGVQVGPLMRRVAEGDLQMRDQYVEQIVAFASTFPDTSYLDRQMCGFHVTVLPFHPLHFCSFLIAINGVRYVNICGAIVDDVASEYFVDIFLPHLFALAADRVLPPRSTCFLSILTPALLGTQRTGGCVPSPGSSVHNGYSLTTEPRTRILTKAGFPSLCHLNRA